ncbi:MAG: DUF1109 family protein [Acidobacteriaceae bacterium]|nr:DUF1109 family protein [Acidobacteriaceae bacterium]
MTCREVDESMMALRPGEQLPETAQEHLRGCAACRTLVSGLRDSAIDNQIDPAVLERIRAPLLASLARVRPLAPAGVFAAGFLIIFAAAAIADSAWFGHAGLSLLTNIQRFLIFGVLMALAVVASVAVARDMRPGARSVRGGVLLGVAVIAIEAIFLALFHDFSTENFLGVGLRCFRSGLLCVIPTALLVWLAVRRGCVLAPVSTGAAVGAIAGLTGVAAQELYCPVLTFPHVAIWHGAVLVVSVAAGSLIGWIADSARRD